jgi:hypothetical protein
MTPTRARRAVYLQNELRELRMRREFGMPHLDGIIDATETLLFVEEAALAADHLFLTPDGALVEIPLEQIA